MRKNSRRATTDRRRRPRRRASTLLTPEDEETKCRGPTARTVDSMGGTIRRARRSDLISLERAGAVHAKRNTRRRHRTRRARTTGNDRTASSCGKSSRFTLGKRACRLATRVGNCIVSNTGFNPSASSERARRREKTRRVSGLCRRRRLCRRRAEYISKNSARAFARLFDRRTDALR